ncbi:MAG: hypothetical protein ACR2FH_05860, partial [Caulobacteraceae bacterium]
PNPAPTTGAAAPAAAGGGDRQAMRAACAADIAKFCPQGGKVGKCLRPHKSELSPACSAAWSARRAARRASRSGGAAAE